MKNLISKLTAVTIMTLLLMSCGSNESSNKSKPNLSLSTKEYVDPKGYFSIFPPENWSIKEFPDDTRGKVHFTKSENNNLMILVKSIPQESFESFFNYCQNEGNEKLIGAGAINLTIDSSKYGDFKVIIRKFNIQGSKSYMIDYLIDGMNHNLYYSAPSNEFDDYIKIIETSIATYHPISKIITPEEKEFQTIESRRRVAKLLFDMGDYEQANNFIQDGLKISPNDSILLEINKELKANSKNENAKKESDEGDGTALPVFLLILTLAGSLVITFSKKIAEGTSWPGLARITAPIIGIIMVITGIEKLFEYGYIFIGILNILLAILVFISPFIVKNLMNKKRK